MGIHEYGNEENQLKSKARIHKILRGMKSRCYKETHPDYNDYGAKGVKVCEEWTNKEEGSTNFERWALENGYSDELSIDRIDVNGNYEPSNCRWATNKEQARNKRNTRYYTIDGIKKPLIDWAEEKGVDYGVVLKRLGYGWSEDRALNEPVINKKKNKLVYINGVGKSLREWSLKSGIDYHKIRNRARRGVSGEDLLKPDLPLGRRVSKVNIDGVEKTLKEWSEISGIDYETIKGRYYKGWRGKELLKSLYGREEK